MSCCSQTTFNPWWGEAESSVPVAARQALGLGAGAQAEGEASGQWYLYIGQRQGAMQFTVDGHAYDAGRVGVSRFLKVEMAHVLKFEQLYGGTFSLLGASDSVTKSVLNHPTMNHKTIIPVGVTERMVRQHDIAKAGDVVGANPALLSTALNINEQAARGWILNMRSTVGFGNQVNAVAERVPPVDLDALANAGRVDAFDFAVLHGITPAHEQKLAENKIHSSRDFIQAGNASISTILGLAPSTTAELFAELRHYLSDKRASA